MSQGEIRLSGTEQLILRLLVASGEMYGLEMVRKAGGELPRGTVYVTLDRMEEKGLVRSRREERDPLVSGIPKRLYQPTGEGARLCRAQERRRALIFGRLARA